MLFSRLNGISDKDAPLVAALALTAGCFDAAPGTALSLALFAVLAVLTFLRLDLALAIVPAFAFLTMQPKHLGHLMFAPTELLIGLDLVVAVVVVSMRRAPLPDVGRAIRSPFLPPAVLFGVAATLSTVLAFDRHLALHAYRERVIDPMLYGTLLLLFMRTRTSWYWLCAALVTGGAIAGSFGLAQFALQRDLSTVHGTGIKRVESLYGSPDNLGLLFDRVIPVWLAFTLALRNRRVGIALFAAGLLLVVPLVLTFSVGAWIAIGIAACVLTVTMVPHGRWIVPVAALFVVAGAAAKHNSIANAFRAGHSNSTQTRLNVWRSSATMIRDNPIVGVGPDNFQRYFAPTYTQDRYNYGCLPGRGYMRPGAGDEPCLSHPHNVFLDFWLSAGILGLGAYLWLMTVFVVQTRNALSRSRDAISRALILGVGAGMLAATLHGLVDNSYFLPDLSLLFWVFCASVSWMASGDSDRITAPITGVT